MKCLYIKPKHVGSLFLKYTTENDFFASFQQKKGLLFSVKFLLFTLFILARSSSYLAAQQVIDPALANPNYEANKAARASASASTPILNRSARLSPLAGSPPSTAATSTCLIPADNTFTGIPRNDDGSFGPVTLPFTFNLYGSAYNQVYINTNGNLTFTQAYSEFNAAGFPFTLPMVAAFWGDVDTRPAASGIISYKLTSQHLIVSWDGVGYYDQQTDKLNTFQIIISDGNDPLIGVGKNVAFYYDDMQWTTGSASDGVNGFGGTPATVGVNKGNNVDYIQVGRFNQNSSVYDGPGGNPDGINYLDNKCFTFYVSTAENVAPSASGLPPNNTINLTVGQTASYDIQFIGPEVGQSVTTTVNTNGLCSTTATVTNGSVSTVSLQVVGAACNIGSHTITLTAMDNGVPVKTTTIDLLVNVTCVSPTLTTPTINPVAASPNQCSAPVSFSASATGSPTLTIVYKIGSTVITSPYTFPVGSTTVTATATNDCGSDVKTFTVTVLDTEKPVAKTKPLTVQLDATGKASINTSQINDGSTDNCTAAASLTLSLSKTNFDCSNLGANSVTLTVTDNSNNVSTATATVTVEDKIAPTVSCPTGEISRCFVAGNTYQIPSLVATDNCTITTITFSVTGATTRTGSGNDASGQFLPGTSSISWTITDQSGNQSQCTSTVVVYAPQAPGLATQSGHAYPGGISNLTISQNVGDVVLTVSGCALGTITWAGGSATALAVSTFNIGAQTFTAVCTQNGCVSPTATATVNVVPTTLLVLSRDPENNLPNTNTLKPYLQLNNQGNQPIPYGEITVRYWLTVENYVPLIYQINYAQLGSDKVHLKYVPASTGNPTATGYIEFSFDASAGSLGANSNSGPIQDLINKQDYSAFNQNNDYSYVNNANFTPNERITAYRNGVLFYGREPGPVVPTQSLKAMLQNNTGPDANSIEAVLSVTNDGNVPVNYADLKVRYYFTADNNQALIPNQVGYTALGSGNVSAQVVTINPPLAGADRYLELSFSGSLGQLAPGANTGGVTYQIRHADYSGFNQTNDYSYQGTGGTMVNPHVVVFVAGTRAYGTEPGAGARLSAEEINIPLRVQVLGNPIRGSAVEVIVSGAEGQAMTLQLTDLTGRSVITRQVERAGIAESQRLEVGNASAGMMLLRVSTPTQSQTVKILRQQ